jgi:hypothetical protein
MAFQLVYTSAAKLLDAGRSGFGTVARAKTISPLLVSAIERVSQFANIRGTNRSRVIFVHRRIVAANNRFHILSRIADAGADYTGRTNHIAHHLIVSLEEVARAAARGLTPADIIRQFQWLPRWDGAARFFTAEDEVILEAFQPLGHQSARSEWSQLTGNPLHARLLAWDGAPRNGVLLMPSGADSLALLAESLAEFGTQSWSRTFTTSLETTDEMTDLDWIITSPDAFSEIQGRCGARTVFDLSRRQSLPVPPDPVQVAPEPCPAVRPARTPAAALLIPPSHVPQVQVVKARVSSGLSSKRSSPVQSTSASRKLRTQMILGGAAALIMLGVLGVAIWRTPHPAKNEKDVAATELSESQQQAVRDLKAIGVGEQDATTVASKAGDKAQEWAKFITGFISEVKKNPPDQNLDSYPQPPSTKEPEGAPAWLGSLISARASLSAYSNSSGAGIPFVKRLEEVSDITKVFKGITKDINNSNDRSGKTALNDEDCDRYDGFLAKRELEKLFGSMQSASADDARKQLKTAITKGELHHEKFPQRYESLCEVIKKHFEKIASQKTLDVLNADKAMVKQDDVAGFECAIGYWNNPAKDIKDEDTTIIENSGFVPKDFKERRPKHKVSDLGTDVAETAKPSTKAADKSSAPDFSGIKENEVIVVSREKLSKGVEVELLKRIIGPYFKKPVMENKISLKELEIAIFPKDDKSQKTELLLSDNKTFYCWTINNISPAPRFFKDVFEFKKNNFSHIIFSLKNDSDEITSNLVIDEKNETPLFENLTFQVDKQDEDNGIISGDLFDRIGNTQVVSKTQQGLTYFPDLQQCRIFESEGKIHLSTINATKPERIIIIAKEDSESISNACDKLPKTGHNNSEKNGEKLLEDLIKKIKFAIGQKLILNEKEFSDKKRINLENLKKAQEIAKNNKLDFSHYNYQEDNEKKYKEWQKKLENNHKSKNISYGDHKNEIDTKNIEEVAIAFGAIQADEIWKKCTKSNYGLDGLSNYGPEEQKKHIMRFVTNTKPLSPDPTFEQKISQLKSITVATPSGRVLYKATRKP